MPANTRDIADALERCGLEPRSIHEEGVVVAGNFEVEGFLNPRGKPEVKIVVSVEDDGNLVSILALDAWVPEGREHDELSRACERLDLVRLRKSTVTGGISPQIQIPVMDSQLTGAQIAEGIERVLESVRELDRVLREPESIENKPGATPARLVALAAFHQWLDEIKKREGNKEKRDDDA